ncbi:MAG: sigma-70 family RNA polymerase sigma factor [Coriobacteriales bacterium]|jgi:RNA polymerase sigma-70 factor (ECF subfamily)|nr:sigma-70 family RNA polymerase sigma factor [Coriobacteriales bacterium]
MNVAAMETCLDTSQTVAQFRDMVYGIALTHTKNRADAEDVFQEVFLVYHRKQPPFVSDERRKAWLITTTLNCSKQLTLGSWRKKVVPIHEQDLESHSDECFHFRTDEQDMVFSALQQLSDQYRIVLHLFYFEDMSVAQISSMLGLEVGTVKVRLLRGRAKMREKLEGEYFDE